MVDTRAIEQALFRRAQQAGDPVAQSIAQQVSANAPKGLTGRLKQAPKVHRDIGPSGIKWTVSVDVNPGGYPYDVAQEEGTGVYIGRGRIYPKRAKYLRFYWRKVGRWVAFRSVKGTPPTRYFSKAVRPWLQRLNESFRGQR